MARRRAREGIADTESSLLEALRVVQRYTSTVGRSAPKVFECPIVLQYGRL